MSQEKVKFKLVFNPWNVLVTPASLSSPLLPWSPPSFLTLLLPSLSSPSLPCHCVLLLLFISLPPLFFLSYSILSSSFFPLLSSIFFVSFIYFPFPLPNTTTFLQLLTHSSYFPFSLQNWLAMIIMLSSTMPRKIYGPMVPLAHDFLVIETSFSNFSAIITKKAKCRFSKRPLEFKAEFQAMEINFFSFLSFHSLFLV